MYRAVSVHMGTMDFVDYADACQWLAHVEPRYAGACISWPGVLGVELVRHINAPMPGYVIPTGPMLS